MRRVVAIAATGLSLAGCSSLSFDAFKAETPPIQVQLESVPSGAEAQTSLGQGCKTPCTVSVPAPDTGFSVSFTLNKFQPATVPVQVIRTPGDFATPPSVTVDPNPVIADLKPVGPVRKTEDAQAAETDRHRTRAGKFAIPGDRVSSTDPLIDRTAPRRRLRTRGPREVLIVRGLHRDYIVLAPRDGSAVAPIKA